MNVYIGIRPGRITKTVTVSKNAWVDYDTKGNIVGIEVIGAVSVDAIRSSDKKTARKRLFRK